MSMKSALVIGMLLLLSLPAAAQKAEVVPSNHCDPEFASDIGMNFASQPNGSFVTASGDCTATPGCDDYFDITCAGGETVTATFCSNGGTADFDTGLSSWNGVAQIDCNDDTCALLSEMSTVIPAAGTFRIRIGGFGTGSGTYTVAVQAPATCSIVGALPVTLQTVEVE